MGSEFPNPPKINWSMSLPSYFGISRRNIKNHLFIFKFFTTKKTDFRAFFLLLRPAFGRGLILVPGVLVVLLKSTI